MWREIFKDVRSLLLGEIKNTKPGSCNSKSDNDYQQAIKKAATFMKPSIIGRECVSTSTVAGKKSESPFAMEKYTRRQTR